MRKRNKGSRHVALGKRVPFERNKSTHVALMYLRSRRSPVRPNELLKLNRGLFEHDPNRALVKLVNLGYATKNDDGTYSITTQGVNILYHIAAHWAQ
jgi:hypothetical protein